MNRHGGVSQGHVPQWRLALSLIRVPMLPVSISSVWVITLLAFVLEPEGHRHSALTALGMTRAMIVTALLACGLHVYTAALNDLLDVRHDRIFNPHRPLIRAAHQRGITAMALSLCVLGLLMAILSAMPLGSASVVICLAVAALSLLFNLMGKFLPAVGVVSLGLIQAGVMFIANPQLSYAWPIWLAMTHVIWSVALMYETRGKRPKLRAGSWWSICGGWVFWSLLLVTWMRSRGEPMPTPDWVWLPPTLAAVAFALVSWAMWRNLKPQAGRYRSRTAQRFGSLAWAWLALYHAGWLMLTSAWPWAVVMGLAFALSAAWAVRAPAR